MQDTLAPLACEVGGRVQSDHPPSWHILVEPARRFRHPRDVLARLDLSNGQKRAILASWASDACAVESAPALRQPPDAGDTVSLDHVLAAIRELDGEPGQAGGDTNRSAGPRRGRLRQFLARVRRSRGRPRLGQGPTEA